MATIKSYTDINQSRKLAEILPLESADMHYCTWTILNEGEYIVSHNQGEIIEELQEDYGNQVIPCWSLVALLSVIPLPNLIQDKADDELFWQCSAYDEDGNLLCEIYDNNAIDACYEMIMQLYKQKLL